MSDTPTSAPPPTSAALEAILLRVKQVGSEASQRAIPDGFGLCLSAGIERYRLARHDEYLRPVVEQIGADPPAYPRVNSTDAARDLLALVASLPELRHSSYAPGWHVSYPRMRDYARSGRALLIVGSPKEGDVEFVRDSLGLGGVLVLPDLNPVQEVLRDVARASGAIVDMSAADTDVAATLRTLDRLGVPAITGSVASAEGRAEAMAYLERAAFDRPDRFPRLRDRLANEHGTRKPLALFAQYVRQGEWETVLAVLGAYAPHVEVKVFGPDDESEAMQAALRGAAGALVLSPDFTSTIRAVSERYGVPLYHYKPLREERDVPSVDALRVALLWIDQASP